MGRKTSGQWLEQIICVFIALARARAVWCSRLNAFLIPSSINTELLSSSLTNVGGVYIGVYIANSAPRHNPGLRTLLSAAKLADWERVGKTNPCVCSSYLPSQRASLRRDGNRPFSQVQLQTFVHLLHARTEKTWWWYDLLTQIRTQHTEHNDVFLGISQPS